MESFSLQKHFSHLIKLLEIEQREEKKIFLDRISRYNIQERVNQGITWYPLTISDWYLDQGDRLVVEVERTKSLELPHEFNTGRLISIFSNKEGSIKETEASGVVMAIRGNQAKVILQLDDFPEWLKTGKIGMNLLYDETSFKEMRAILRTLMKNEVPRISRLIQVAYGFKEPVFKECTIAPIAKLNDSQVLALKNALEAEEIAIVHGPPGTGKTTTLIAIIKELLVTEKQVLVCAASNNAVDLVVEKLHAEGVSVLRIGNPARINEATVQHSLSQMVASHPDFGQIKKMKKQAQEYRNLASKYKRQFGFSEREQRKALFNEAWQLQKDADAIEEYITEDLINKSQVIASTLVGASHYSIRDRIYPVVLIDEASQALEPATWIPMIRGNKVILAGDHKQLPPTVKSHEAAVQGLSQSLFETIMSRQKVDVMLSTQYRMNHQIMSFSNSEFYHNQLLAHPSVKGHTLLTDEKPFEFIDTAGCGFSEEEQKNVSQGAGSLMNTNEADLLGKHLLGLYQKMQEAGIDISTINCGVISPYKAQVEFLKTMLSDFPIADARISINTVDGFQGQERDIIYISLVRSNSENEIGFLRDYRRLNVALTRAKKKLVVIGDSATLGSDSFYTRFIEYAESVDAYASAWEFLYL